MLAPLQPGALAATRAAALACRVHVGRAEPEAADAAAVEAMRRALASLPARGVVIVSEGMTDDGPRLHAGERIGDVRAGAGVDVVVDPLECTEYRAHGLPGSLATIAFAVPGALWLPGPAVYMDKLVAPAAARGALDIADPPERTLRRLADALGRPVGDLRVCILDRPRNAELIARVRAAGAAVHTSPQGDVGRSLAAIVPRPGVDLLLGVGGAPQGVMTACAVRALGAEMQARIAPQSEREAAAVRAAGFDGGVLGVDDLVRGESMFVATGVTDGLLLRGPRESAGWIETDSIVVADGAVRRVRDLQPVVEPHGDRMAGDRVETVPAVAED